jgi:hypothetical protein
MELELRNYLKSQHTPNFKAEISKKLHANEDVDGRWCQATGKRLKAMLELVVNLFLTIRGFAYTSVWPEQYKAASAKTLQKSKGLRRGLFPLTLSKSCTT